MKYLFEARQGLSYGRNTGIAAAKAPIIAFTDDDVRVAPDWVWRIKSGFEANPEIDFLGGKVVPRWPAEPPAWLTRPNWSPLALLDYGDSRFYVDSEKQLCLIGANFAFRRSAFDKVGLFKTDFQRVKDGIGSLEDHEMLLRLWRAGSRGLYLPELVVTAEIEPERMEKKYHRKWHTSHGRFYAALHSEEVEQSRLGKFLAYPPIFIVRLSAMPEDGPPRSFADNRETHSRMSWESVTSVASPGRRWREFFSPADRRGRGKAKSSS